VRRVVSLVSVQSPLRVAIKRLVPVARRAAPAPFVFPVAMDALLTIEPATLPRARKPGKRRGLKSLAKAAILHCSTRHKSQGARMTIKVGDKLPAGTLTEYVEVEGNGCSIGPNEFKVEDLTRGKKVVIFGLPGAFTPTCSAKHVPGYVAAIDRLKAKGVDDVICMSVNDAFVMGAWARDQKSGGKVRMMGDGSAAYTKALGLELDLNARGMGTRCQRYSMLVDNGVVKTLNIEAPGKFEVSDADTMLKQAG
jgi:peroxiredoxin